MEGSLYNSGRDSHQAYEREQHDIAPWDETKVPKHKMGIEKVVVGHWGGEEIVRPMTIAEKMERDVHDKKAKEGLNLMVNIFDHVTRPKVYGGGYLARHNPELLDDLRGIEHYSEDNDFN